MVAACAQSIDDNLRAPVTGYLEVSEQQWAAVLTDVRSQEDLLGGLRAVQPIVNKSGEYFDELMAEIEDYIKILAELDRKEVEVLNDLALARLQFVTWARAHQALANGVEDPGKWMELAIKGAKIVSDVL